MSSLFKARAENAAKVVSLQNEINALKTKLEAISKPDTSELDALRKQIKSLTEENQSLKLELSNLKQEAASTPKSPQKKKRGPKAKSSEELSEEG